MTLESLLRALVEERHEVVATVLHEQVRFRQGDGTVHEGRDTVLALFARDGSEVRHEVIEQGRGMVRVAMYVEGVPGTFSFLLCGRAEDERLVEVWIEA